MGLGDSLRRLLRSDEAIRVHVIIRGRIGHGWVDVDETLRLPLGATLSQLVTEAERRGIPLREAIANSPHLAHTLMVNGERCPIEEHQDRPLVDGDEIYLLSPLAGG